MEDFQKALEEYIPAEVLSHFREQKIAIIGCGGLGSNIAMMLTRTGFTQFLLMDFDKVSIGNLNRQQYILSQCGQYKTDALAENMSKVTDNLSVEIYKEALTIENCQHLLKDYNVIVEAVDIASTKVMLIEEFIGTKKFIVSGSGMGGLGSFSTLEAKQKQNIFIAGDGKTICDKKTPPFMPRVVTVAAMQADAIIRYCWEQKETPPNA